MDFITSDYLEYINSPEWARIRNKILLRDDYACSYCGSRRNLQVHHLTYENFKNEENHLADLITLCKNCHEKIEKRKKDQDEENYRISQEYYEQQKIKWEEERKKLYKKLEENYNKFIKENNEKDLSNLGVGTCDFCDFRFLKKYLLNNYGEEFYNNIKKSKITNYFGNKRTIAILKLISEGKKDYEIKKYGFTYKRISNVRNLVKEFSQYNNIFELTRKYYSAKMYGFTIDKNLIIELIKYNFIKDNKYSKDILLNRIDTIIIDAELSQEFAEIEEPILE